MIDVLSCMLGSSSLGPAWQMEIRRMVCCASGIHASHLCLHILTPAHVVRYPVCRCSLVLCSFQELFSCPLTQAWSSIFLLQSSSDSPDLRTLSLSFELFLPIDPYKPVKLSPSLSLRFSSHAWLSEELTPDTCNL